jgi:hypothetical protein
MEGRFYKIGFFTVIIIIVILGIYYLFKDKKPKDFLPTSGNYVGGISMRDGFRGGDSFSNSNINNYNNTILNSQNLSRNNFQNNVSEVNKKASLNYSASSVFLVDETVTKNLIKKSGDTLSFASTSKEEMDDVVLDKIALDSGNDRSFKTPNRTCGLIFENIVKDKQKILALGYVKQESYLLQRLRQIPNFGGLSFEKQKEIITSLLNALRSDKKIDSSSYCDNILSSPSGIVYMQCLRAMDKIISQKITNPQQIEKILAQEITSFMYLYTKEQREDIIKMIIDGVKNNTLSKEKLCAFLQSLAIQNIQDTFLYKQCIKVLNDLSNSAALLSDDMILDALMKITGFSSLSKNQVDEIVRDIKQDKIKNGFLNAEIHCLKIVAWLLEAIRGSDVYKKCIEVLDKIVENPSQDLMKALETIPGFSMLSTQTQKDIVITINNAIADGTIKEESKRNDICTTIAGLILDAFNKNKLYQQCLKVLNDIIDNNLNVQGQESAIRQKLTSIYGFSLLDEEKKQEIVNQIMEINKNDENVKTKISNVCINITQSIIDAIKNSEAYLKCMDIITDISNTKPRLDVGQIREKLKEINGFSAIDEAKQIEFAERVYDSITNNTLEDDKSQICIDIVLEISDGLDVNSLKQNCIILLTKAFANDTISREQIEFILRKLLSKENFEIYGDEYVTNIMNFPLERDALNVSINTFCSMLEDLGSENASTTECVKDIFLIASGNKDEQFLYNIKKFASFSREQKQKLILPQIQSLKNSKKNSKKNLSTNDILSESLKICNTSLPAMPTDGADGLDVNSLKQNCIILLTNAFASNPITGEQIESILSKLLSKENFETYKDEYVANIMNFPRAVNLLNINIANFCAMLGGLDDDNISMTECVRDVLSIVSGAKKEDIVYNIKKFASFSREQKQKLILPQIQSLKNTLTSARKNVSMTKVLFESLKICNTSRPTYNGNTNNENNGNTNNENNGNTNNENNGNTNNENFKDPEGETSSNELNDNPPPNNTPDPNNPIENSGNENTGKCAVLSSKIFNAYQSYNKNLSSVPNQDTSVITQINDGLIDGEYYIPSNYITTIEEIMGNDFERILDNKKPFPSKYTHDLERDNLLLIENTLYQFFYQMQIDSNIANNPLYKSVLSTLSEACTTKKDAATTVSELMTIQEFLNFANSEEEKPSYDNSVLQITTLLEKCIKNKPSDNDIESLSNLIARSIGKYGTNSNSAVYSIQSLIPKRAKSNFIFRLFRDRDFIRNIHTGEDVELDYIMQIGRCTRPDKDFDYWLLVSKEMQDVIMGKHTPSINMSSNNNYFRSTFLQSKDYLDVLALVNNALNEPSENGSNRMSKLISIPGFKGLSEARRDDFQSQFANLAACKSELCKAKVQEFSYNLTLELIPTRESMDNEMPNSLSLIAKCDNEKMLNNTSSTEVKEFFQFPLAIQSVIASNARTLLRNFESSAKKQRYRIVEAMWYFTKDKGKAVPVAQCEQIANDVWSTYNTNYLQDSLGEALQSIADTLIDLVNSLDSGGKLNYTIPPSQRCKCHMEQLYQKLHDNVITGYQDCYNVSNSSSRTRSSGTSPHMVYINTLTDIYISSKESSLSALAESTGQEQGKSLCVMLFKTIRSMAADTHEAKKFVRNDVNNTTLKQICVQQLRDIYNTVLTFKENYFSIQDENLYKNENNCSRFPDY